MEGADLIPITNSKIFRLVYESLREMRQTQGVQAFKVCDLVQRKYLGGGSPPSKDDLKIALRRGVRDGYLIYNNRRYNLETDECGRGCLPKKSKPKPGFVKRIKRYFSNLIKSRCKKSRKKKSKKCKRRERRKKKSKSRQKKKRSKSRCGC